MIIIPNGILMARILYVIPDCEFTLQEFSIQMDDVHPLYPRFDKFLRYWVDNDLATIKHVEKAFRYGSNSYRISI
jgi:uncharacterized protein Usg